MKKLLTLLLVSADTAFSGTATIPTAPPVIPAAAQPFESELEAAIISGWLNVDVEGIFAPTLAKHIGAEIKLSHPVTDKDSPYGADIGVSLMALNGNYYSGSFGASLRKVFTIPGIEQFPITPKVEAGAYLPFNTTAGTTQSSDASLGAYTEAGAMIQLWHNKTGTFTFEVGGSYKRIFSTGGGINTFNGLAEIKIKL